MDDPVERPGDDPLPNHQHEGDESADLEDGQEQRKRDRASPSAGARGKGDCGQQHQSKNGGEILDDQPADRDPAALGVDQVPAFQRPKEDDRARHG